MLDPMEPATDLCVSLFANRQSVRSLFLAPNGSLLRLFFGVRISAAGQNDQSPLREGKKGEREERKRKKRKKEEKKRRKEEKERI